MQQLQLLKPRLLEQINSHLDDTPIKDLYLRRGQLKKTIKAIEPELELPELDPAETATIHRLTQKIEDDEVRAALNSLFLKHRRLEKLTKNQKKL
ncbi:MAG: hypothetical protein B6I36_09305 [Desulfobacteraceae bacterium 4572_35.1]|nr:MAG: hypothetical protein B6I36_09305 [Desulfobacteraceae bacterium 4572_35.1]